MKIVNPLSERHKAQMEQLGRFCAADAVDFEDKCSGEVYKVFKKDRMLVLKACGSKVVGRRRARGVAGYATFSAREPK